MIIIHIRACLCIRLHSLRQILQILCRRLKPRMLRRSMIHHKINHDADSPLMACVHECLEILHCAILLIDRTVVRHIIFVVSRRRHHRHQPDPITSQICIRCRITVIDIVQLLRQSRKISDAIPIAVIEAVNEHLVPAPVEIIRSCSFCRVYLPHQRQRRLFQVLLCSRLRIRALPGCRLRVLPGCRFRRTCCRVFLPGIRSARRTSSKQRHCQ